LQREVGLFIRILSYFYPLFCFIGTLVYVRGSAALIRRQIDGEKANNWSSLKANIAFCAPSLSVAVLLLLLRNERGWIFISSTAIWISIVWDGFSLIATLLFTSRLRQLRRAPASFTSVTLSPVQDIAKWPHARSFHLTVLVSWWMRATFLQIGLDNIPIVRRILQKSVSSRYLRVAPGDFREFLGGDLRYIDVLSDYEDELGFDPDKLIEVPHLLVTRTSVLGRAAGKVLSHLSGHKFDLDEEESDDDEEANEWDFDLRTLLRQLTGATSKSYPLNRALNMKLSDELWEASQAICQNTPQVVATSWKLFHFQDETRLRLVTLFNTADLIQRLVGSFVLATLRNSGELEEMVQDGRGPGAEQSVTKMSVPRTPREWNRSLAWYLEHSVTPSLDPLRSMLLSPRADFDELQKKLDPFWDLLGGRQFPEHRVSHTLGAWDVFRVIRNQTIGHGMVGLHIKLDPLKYLVPLHEYFLEVMRDVVMLDLAVYSFDAQAEDGIVGFSGGLRSACTVEECDVWLRTHGTDNNFTNVSPYLRFYRGTVLFPNRLMNSGAEFEYVNYRPKSIAEPSFIKLPVDAASFLQSRI
jgi:hypothetical protein